MGTALWSALYWFGTLCVLGFVIIVHGDCGVADDIHECAVGAQRIDWAGIVIALVLYAFLLWRRVVSKAKPQD